MASGIGIFTKWKYEVPLLCVDGTHSPVWLRAWPILWSKWNVFWSNNQKQDRMTSFSVHNKNSVHSCFTGSTSSGSLVPRPLPDFILQLWRETIGQTGQLDVSMSNYTPDRTTTCTQEVQKWMHKGCNVRHLEWISTSST